MLLQLLYYNFVANIIILHYTVFHNYYMIAAAMASVYNTFLCSGGHFVVWRFCVNEINVMC